jgi:hypothetical protein
VKRCLALAIGIASFAAAAHAELPAVRVTHDANPDDEPTASGRRIAWTRVDAGGSDREVFWLDTAHPLDVLIPQPCPLSNPCQVSENEVADDGPQLTANGVFWTTRDVAAPGATLHFFDGVDQIAVPGTLADANQAPPSASGPLVLWWGRDDDDRAGIFLFDVTKPADDGPAALCPGSNPCTIVLGDVELDELSAPRLAGTRAAWAAVPEGTGSDLEIVLFDAARAADAGPPAACPTTNPCLVTSNDVADSAPAVSPSHIAWTRCPDDACWSAPPASALVASDDETVEIEIEELSGAVAISDPWVTWSSYWGTVFLFDTRDAVQLDPLGYPQECPTTNPCVLEGGYWTPFLVGSQLLLDTTTDIPGPISLRLVDVRRPVDEPPYASCQLDGNPCIVRDPANIGRAVYSGALVAWTECAGEDLCYDQNSTAELYYALPEPGGAGGAAALLALAAIAARPRRSAAPTPRRTSAPGWRARDRERARGSARSRS